MQRLGSLGSLLAGCLLGQLAAWFRAHAHSKAGDSPGINGTETVRGQLSCAETVVTRIRPRRWRGRQLVQHARTCKQGGSQRDDGSVEAQPAVSQQLVVCAQPKGVCLLWLLCFVVRVCFALLIGATACLVWPTTCMQPLKPMKPPRVWLVWPPGAIQTPLLALLTHPPCWHQRRNSVLAGVPRFCNTYMAAGNLTTTL